MAGVPLSRAELIVALDYPRWFSPQRLLRRTTTRALDQRLTCNGNRKSLRLALSRDSIVVWHFQSFRRKRRRIRRCAKRPRLLLDTSVAVPAVLSDHEHHAAALQLVTGSSMGYAGHAWFETYSVLTGSRCRSTGRARRRCC